MQFLVKISGYLRRLADPRQLMLVAGVVAVMGFVAGYAEFQNQAVRVLAERLGPPQAVSLQDFSFERNTGPADEVRVVAEAKLEDTIFINLRGTHMPRDVLVTPLFPISDEGAAVLLARLSEEGASLGSEITAMPESHRSDPPALGLLYQIVPEGTVEAGDLPKFVSKIYGRGAYGMIIELNGLNAVPRGLQPVFDGALAAKNTTLIEGYLPITPFPEGRAAYFAAIEPSRSHQMLYLIAAVLALVSLGASVRPDASNGPAVSVGGNTGPEAGRVSATRALHPKFARIPSQEELAAEINGRGDQRNEPAHHVLSKVKSAVLAIRNRRSRQEDEAL